MPTATAKQSELTDRFVTHLGGTGHVTGTDRVRFNPIGIWTVDPAESSVSFTWRKFRLWTVTGRLRGLGVIHLDELPPVGVIRFQQSSGLPVLTMALGPASVETNGADPNAMLGNPDVVDVRRHRWWTLRSESLEILPDGGWRVMATLTTNRTSGLVDLRLEVDLGASSPDRLVLRGRGVLDRRAFGIGMPATMFNRQIGLELAVRARRVMPASAPRDGNRRRSHAQPACRAELAVGRPAPDRTTGACRPGAPVVGRWLALSPAQVACQPLVAARLAGRHPASAVSRPRRIGPFRPGGR